MDAQTKEKIQLHGCTCKEQGITVNVIGVMDQDVIDEQGLKEIEGIALAGGGVSQIVYAKSSPNSTNGNKKGNDTNATRGCE